RCWDDEEYAGGLFLGSCSRILDRDDWLRHLRADHDWWSAAWPRALGAFLLGRCPVHGNDTASSSIRIHGSDRFVDRRQYQSVERPRYLWPTYDLSDLR